MSEAVSALLNVMQANAIGVAIDESCDLLFDFNDEAADEYNDVYRRAQALSFVERVEFAEQMIKRWTEYRRRAAVEVS